MNWATKIVNSKKSESKLLIHYTEMRRIRTFEDRVGETIDGARETSNGESADDVAPTVLSTAATTVSNALAKSRAGVFGKLANAAGATVRGISSRVKPVKMFAAARNAMEPSRAIATVKLPHTSSTKWSLCALQPTPGTAAALTARAASLVRRRTSELRPLRGRGGWFSASLGAGPASKSARAPCACGFCLRPS